MATNISQRFYDKLRKHFETGVRWQDMSFSDDQKRRIDVCMDAYKRFATDPFIDLRQYLQNRWSRTYSELRNDLKLIDFISSFYTTGQRNISTMKVRHAADTLMRNGADTGNMKALADGAGLLFKLERLDQPETPEEMGDQLISMPVVITGEVQKKFPNKASHSAEEMERLRRKYGVKKDHWQEMVEVSDSSFEPAADEEEAEEEESIYGPEE